MITVRQNAFWWGVSLALPAGLLAIPLVGYAGAAVVNIVWRPIFGRDASEPTAFFGGLLYGVAFGTALQCLIVGALAQIAWRLGLRRLEPWLLSAPWSTRTFVWIGAEMLYLLSMVWSLMALGAYSLPALLVWLFSYPADP